MRLTVRHQTLYRFVQPASAIAQTLRITPRGHDGQHVVGWRIDIDKDCRLRTAEDAFGNLTSMFTVDGPIDVLTVVAEGEIDTRDTAGMVHGAVERFPPELYLRETDLTAPDLEIAEFAREATKSDASPLGRMHALMGALHERIAYDETPTDSNTTAAQAFRLERGVCQDLTHVFLAAARSLGVPARYVGGYLLRTPEIEPGAAMSQSTDGMRQHMSAPPSVPVEQRAGHAWAEAYVPDFGWIGFDPANDLCPTEGYLRVAIGLDYLGAAPVRGSRYGGAGETLDVRITVEDCTGRRAYRS
ncbi:transglutaminase family protein [Methylopila sp. M107]|uniref:transglutaminase family protein n=1 Tax=Methylopila sp. M107 TaxID=1101190 RepID=UPI000375CF35|nr:transglutaminase family protein [Methylopila sp. M107]